MTPAGIVLDHLATLSHALLASLGIVSPAPVVPPNPAEYVVYHRGEYSSGYLERTSRAAATGSLHTRLIVDHAHGARSVTALDVNCEALTVRTRFVDWTNTARTFSWREPYWESARRLSTETLLFRVACLGDQGPLMDKDGRTLGFRDD